MIPTFALRLICGLSTLWCLAPRSKITSGYFRIQMLVTLGLGVLSALTLPQLTLREPSTASMARTFLLTVSITTAALSFLGSVLWTLERRSGGLLCALLVCLWSTVGVVAIALLGSGTGGTALRILNGLTSAWLLGGVTGAMLLGHWYLTATGMSLTPFLQYNALLGGAALLRLVTAALSPHSGSNWPLLILRWAGIAGPLLLCGLTHRVLKYRNTQSATGVLYAATILVYLGEMASVLIDRPPE